MSWNDHVDDGVRADGGTKSARRVAGQSRIGSLGFRLLSYRRARHRIGIRPLQERARSAGALQALTQHTGGMALVWLITVGLIGYALWRFSEAAFGVASEGARLGRDCSRSREN